jgi:ATP-dependent helicase/nuclease subunit A
MMNLTTIHTDKNTVLRAGAGAGKTTELVRRVLDYVTNYRTQHGKDPHLVVTTFTRKATQELKERLSQKALEINDYSLFLYVNNHSKLSITTIHGLLTKFLNKNADLLEMAPSISMVTDFENQKKAKKILKNILNQPSSISSHLKVDSIFDQTTFAGLLKFCLLYFELWCYDSNLSFVDQNQIIQKINLSKVDLLNNLEEWVKFVETCNLNSSWTTYVQGVKELLIPVSAQSEDFDLIFNQVGEYLDKAKKPSYLKKNPPFPEEQQTEFETLRKDFDKMMDWRVSQDFILKHEQFHQELSVLFKEFCLKFWDFKMKTSLLAMSDLEPLSLKLIREKPEVAKIFSNEWDYWFIDEYQDTSPRQEEILLQLIGDKKYFIVGDPQQSIYLFRGADSTLFEKALLRVSQEQGSTLEKQDNHRTRPGVLYFFNDLFQRIDSEQFKPMEPDFNRQRESIYTEDFKVLLVETDPNEVNDEDQDDNQTDENQTGENPLALAALAQVQDLIRKGVSPEKICLLVRTNKDVQTLANLCFTNHLSAQAHGGSGFLDKREIQDAQALLSFLINPHNNETFIELFRSPFWRVEDTELIQYCDRKETSFWKLVSTQMNSLREKNPDQPFVQVAELIQEAQSRGVGYVWHQALIQKGYFDIAKHLDTSGVHEANLWKLVSVVRAKERETGLNYLSWIQEELFQAQENESKDAVPVVLPQKINIMTIHASKGLEFDYVLLPFLASEVKKSHNKEFAFAKDFWGFPILDEVGSKSFSPQAYEFFENEFLREKQENLRLFYVALTRVKVHVTFLLESTNSFKKIKERSWGAQILNFINTQEGVHEELKYRYLVEKNTLTLKSQPELREFLTQIPEPYLKELPTSLVKNIGVTEFIETHRSSNKVDVNFQRQNKADQMLSLQEKAKRGLQLHELFESLKYHRGERLIAFLKKMNDPLLSEAVVEITQGTLKWIMQLISDGHVEWGFSMQLKENLILTGQIDLWGRDEQQKVWILDYKTGSSKYSEKALKQLKVYAWCLYKMSKISVQESVNLSVVFPFEKITKKLENLNYEKLDAEIQSDLETYLSVDYSSDCLS